jgi:hypothetical protein
MYQQRVKLKENMLGITKEQEQVTIIESDRSQSPTQYLVTNGTQTKTLTYSDFDTNSIIFATPRQKAFIEKLEKRHQTTFNGKTLTELSQFINQYT